jgi:hypothetical protein
MDVRIEVETRTWITRSIDPEDSWDKGDTAGEVANVTATSTDAAIEGSWYGDSVVSLPGIHVGDTIYVVVVDYESGNTFGRYGGYYQILDAFTSNEDAEALCSLARAYDTAEKRNYTESLTYKNKEYYASWKGYFESTNSIDIWAVTVRGSMEKSGSHFSYRQGK